MRRIKQRNNWVVKFDPNRDATQGRKGEGSYAVFAPDGRCMEDRLTPSQADEFCDENLDFVVRPRRRA